MEAVGSKLITLRQKTQSKSGGGDEGLYDSCCTIAFLTDVLLLCCTPPNYFKSRM